MYSDSDINKIKELIIHNIPIVTDVILFGSYANGTDNEKSDVDILILMDKEIDWRDRHRFLNKIYRESTIYGFHIDYLLKTKDNFENDLNLPTLSRVIAREGRVIWKKN